jgi:hypothetical protein
MRDHDVVNRVVADADLLAQAMAFAHKLASGPTRAMQPIRDCCVFGRSEE